MAEQAGAISEHLLPTIKPLMHLEPQQAGQVIDAGVRISEFVTAVRDNQGHIMRLIPHPIPPEIFLQRVMIAMDNARQEQRSLIKPPIPPDQLILVRVQDALFNSFNQLPPAAAARDYHSTFGPALHAQSDQEQMTTITSARDTYRERLEFVEGIKQLHQLGQTKGIVLTARLMDILPTDDQMRQARAILYVLNNAAQARIASMETQELTSLRALQQREEQLTALLWPTPQTSPKSLAQGGWKLSPADKAALRDPYAGYFRE